MVHVLKGDIEAGDIIRKRMPFFMVPV